jgi:glutamate/aspartate transport system substrate-binding protein
MFPFRCLHALAILLTTALMSAFCAESRADVPVSTLQRISETGVIRIGYSADTLPFSYVVGGGAPMGYSIDLCNRIVSHLRQSLRMADLKIEYVQRTASNRVALLKDGTIDLECAASTNNAERRKSVSFSYSHFAATTLFVTLRANKLHTVADLSGRTVTSLKGSTNIGQLSTVNRQRNLRMAILPTETHRAAFDMVTEGRVSAFAMDGILLTTMIANAVQPEIYSLSAEALGPSEPYGLMLRLNDLAFKKAVNAALLSIYSSGEVHTIYRRWFQSPIVPPGINLNLPMTVELRRMFEHPVDLI